MSISLFPLYEFLNQNTIAEWDKKIRVIHTRSCNVICIITQTRSSLSQNHKMGVDFLDVFEKHQLVLTAFLQNDEIYRVASLLLLIIYQIFSKNAIKRLR